MHSVLKYLYTCTTFKKKLKHRWLTIIMPLISRVNCSITMLIWFVISNSRQPSYTFSIYSSCNISRNKSCKQFCNKNLIFVLIIIIISTKWAITSHLKPLSKKHHNILLFLCFLMPLLVLKITQLQDKYLIYFDIYKQRCLPFHCIVLFQV